MDTGKNVSGKDAGKKKSGIITYTVSTFAIVLWGISYIWINKLISIGIPVTYFVFVRILLAGLILFLLNAAMGRITPIKRADLPKFLLLAFCEPFIYFICESLGIQQTGSPTLSAMIIATIPLFSTGAGILFFNERISRINITGIILSLVGIALVVMEKGRPGEHFIFGILLLLIAVISEVGHASLTKSLSGNYTSQTIVMYQFLIGSVYLLPLFLFKGLDNFSAEKYMSLEVWYPIICLGVFCSSMAFSLWVSTIKHLGVARSSIFSALIPVVAAVAAWILGHEELTMRQFIGILISAGGVVMSQYTGKTKKVTGK